MLSWLYNSRFNDKLDIWSIFKYMYFHGPSKVYSSFNTWFWSSLPHWYVVNLLPVSLSERLSDTDSSLQMVVRDLEILSRDEIPGLIQESLSSQVSHILTGDYNLKLARQDYFISNQDQV